MKCCVPFCKNWSEGKNGLLSFHPFPLDETLRQVWIEIIGREQGWAPTKYTVICSTHFEDHQIYITRRGDIKVRDGAVPTINFYPQPTDDAINPKWDRLSDHDQSDDAISYLESQLSTLTVANKGPAITADLLHRVTGYPLFRHGHAPDFSR